MASYTTNYGLHQWEGADDFLRTDFNTDFGIIDGALGDKVEMIVGSYTGDGAETRVISLGVTPRAVLLECMDGNRGAYCPGGLAVTDGPVRYSSNALPLALSIVEGGFQVSYKQYTNETNKPSEVLRYAAFL